MPSRTLQVNITGDPSSLKGAVGSAEATLGGFADKARTFGQQLTSAGRRMTFGITLPVVALAKVAFDELKDSQAAAAQTNAVIKSTGGVANVTAKQVDKLSSSLLRKSGIDDEIIHRGANVLLTFKQVRNEVGRGNQIFDRATKAALNLSVAGFGSMEDTSKQLGKALADPILGLTALRRAGVNFTQSQKDTIKSLVESGDVLSAQKIILAEVESQVGGSAEAYGKTLGGQVGKATEELKNSAAAILVHVLPALIGLARVAKDVAEFFSTLPQPVQMAVLAFVGLLAILGPLTYAIGALTTAVSVSAGVIGAISGPVALIVIAIGLLIGVAIVFATQWDSIWNWISHHQAYAILIAVILSIVNPFILLAAVIGAFAANWSSIWGWIRQAATDAVAWIVGAFNNLVGFVAGLPGRIVGAFGGMFDDMFNVGLQIVNGIIAGISNAAGWLFSKVKNLAKDALNAALDALGIGSPSKLFAERVGLPIVQGWAQGITNNDQIVHDAIGGVASALPDTASPSTSITSSLAASTAAGLGGAGGVTVIVQADMIVHDRDFEDMVVDAVARAGANGGLNRAIPASAIAS